jgi:hypothetical protein
LRIHVDDGGLCSFGYQLRDSVSRAFPVRFQAVEGVWVGAKIGLFAVAIRRQPADNGQMSDPAHADFDYLRFRPPAPDAEQ